MWTLQSSSPAKMERIWFTAWWVMVASHCRVCGEALGGRWCVVGCRRQCQRRMKLLPALADLLFLRLCLLRVGGVTGSDSFCFRTCCPCVILKSLSACGRWRSSVVFFMILFMVKSRWHNSSSRAVDALHSVHTHRITHM